MTINLCVDDRAELHESAGGQTLGAGPTNITFDTVARSDSGFTTAATSITVTDTGNYDIQYYGSIKTNNNSRTTYRHDLQVNGVTVASGYSYHRTGANNNFDSAALFRDVLISAGQAVTVQMTRVQGTGSGAITSNGATLRVTRS